MKLQIRGRTATQAYIDVYICTHTKQHEGMSAMLVGRMRGSGNTKRFISTEGKKNRAIKPSCQTKNLLMAHIHICKFRKTKENLSSR